MIQFSEKIYRRFLHHQCNYLFQFSLLFCFAVVVEIKLNRNTNYKLQNIMYDLK